MKNAIGAKIRKNMDNISRITRFCEQFSEIYVYGAGNAAEEVLTYFAEEGIKCAGVIVSDKRRKSTLFKGIKVYEFSEIKYDNSMGIILALAPFNQMDVLKNIKDNGTPSLSNLYLQYRHKMSYDCTSKGYFEDYKDLDSIGHKFGTDKNSDYHNYLDKYDFFLNKFRDKEINVLELGVSKGASIAMWEEYFPKAIIYGVDINEKCRIYEEGRKRILIEDLSYEDQIRKLVDIAPEIIIDDASHIWSHQIKALYELLPCIPPGGVYILEDLETSFGAHTAKYADASVSTYDFLSAISEVVTSYGNLRLERLSCNFYPVKDEIEYLANQIEMMSFIEGSCVIIKK